jgi:hypothetical protein
VEQGGHMITSGHVYSGAQLNSITGLRIQPIVAQRGHNTLEGVERDRPDDRIRMTATVRTAPDLPWMQLSTDEVRYVVNESNDTFYPNLQFDRPRYWDRNDIMSGVVLRDALISEAVYDVKDLPQFGQQLLNEQQLWELGLPAKVVLQLLESANPDSTGFRAAIYRDFLSPSGKGYVLAFAGTTLQVQDILTDIIQAAGLSGNDWLEKFGVRNQFGTAMELGFRFGRATRDAGVDPRITGHSLGGGLASAASIAANRSAVPANTFNAAGLHRNTICKRDASGNLQPNLPAYDGAFAQFTLEQGNTGRIKAFYVNYELLTFLQNNLPPISEFGSIPRAAGAPVKLTGHLLPSMQAREKFVQATLAQMPVRTKGMPLLVWTKMMKTWLESTIALNAGFFLDAGSLHAMRSVLYGLMVERNVVDGRYSGRKFDIFGYKRNEDF